MTASEVNDRRLFILGAGASYAAGLPDAGQLLGHLWGYAGGAPWEIVLNRMPNAHFRPLLGTLFGVLGELSEGGSQERWPLDQVFDSFYARVRADPARFEIPLHLLFETTAQLLYIRSLYGGSTDAYLHFVEALAPRDIILTLNWDVCPEVALHAVGRSFSRLPTTSPPTEMPWILKLHGSVDEVIVRTDVQRSRPGLPAFLEWYGLQPPSPVPGASYGLARLRTYDLDIGVELHFNGVRQSQVKSEGTVVGGYDVGPFLLLYALDEYPAHHMLTPGAPSVLYEWQYELIDNAIGAACPEIGQIAVVGYSFPGYDRRVHELLRTIHKAANCPPTSIINPSADDLPKEVVYSIFGEVEVHACGFEDYQWNSE